MWGKKKASDKIHYYSKCFSQIKFYLVYFVDSEEIIITLVKSNEKKTVESAIVHIAEFIILETQ